MMLRTGMILSYVIAKFIKFVQPKSQESLTEKMGNVGGYLLSMLSKINDACV